MSWSTPQLALAKASRGKTSRTPGCLSVGAAEVAGAPAAATATAVLAEVALSAGAGAGPQGNQKVSTDSLVIALCSKALQTQAAQSSQSDPLVGIHRHCSDVVSSDPCPSSPSGQGT